MTAKTSVLVAGATGRQGGAVARALLARGHSVRAIARDPAAPQARALASAGAELVAGDFDDDAALARAAKGMDAVFAVTTPAKGVETETRHGIALVEAARDAGVKHIVFSSVASADRNTKIPHFESKYRVEQHLRDLGVPFTIIGPVSFMENLTAPWMSGGLKSGVYAFPLRRDRTLQQVAIADIAGFAAAAIARPAEFAGRRIDIASDEKTGEEYASILAKATGRAMQYVEVPRERVPPETAIMFEWMDRVGFDVNIESLKAQYPDVGWHSFSGWAAEQDWQ